MSSSTRRAESPRHGKLLEAVATASASAAGHAHLALLNLFTTLLQVVAAADDNINCRHTCVMTATRRAARQAGKQWDTGRRRETGRRAGKGVQHGRQ